MSDPFTERFIADLQAFGATRDPATGAWTWNENPCANVVGPRGAPSFDKAAAMALGKMQGEALDPLLDKLLKTVEDAAQAKARHIEALQTPPSTEELFTIAAAWRRAEEATHDLLKEYLEKKGLTLANAKQEARHDEVNARLHQESLEASTWEELPTSHCSRCGQPYETPLRPTCECAGDPPVDLTSNDYAQWMTRVIRLRVYP